MKKSIEKRLGQAILVRCRTRGITQTRIALKSGTSKGYVSEIIQGKKSPSLPKLVAISRALKVRLSWLLDDVGE
jgi:transcriptional regulator with XRE-family HTH domain